MKTRRPLRCAAALVAALTLLAGCASQHSPDAIMDRVDANRAEYETWPLAVKESVLSGVVTKGMTPTMVFVALGKPKEVVTRDNGDEVWVYDLGRSSGSSSGGSAPVASSGPRSVTIGGGSGGVFIGGSPVVLGGGGGGSVLPDPVVEREVWFRNGVVVRGDGIK